MSSDHYPSFSCPDGWTMSISTTHCLLYVPTKMTWSEAEVMGLNTSIRVKCLYNNLTKVVKDRQLMLNYIFGHFGAVKTSFEHNTDI